MFFKTQNIKHRVKQFKQCIKICTKSKKRLITMEFANGDLTLLSIPQNANKFTSNKYTTLNFLPQTIFENFTRLANIILLMISMIMLINPSLSPFYRWITIIPLGFNQLVYFIKELILDYKRCQTDDFINNQKTVRGSRKSGGLEENVLWQDILIGDIVYLKKGEIVPADLILLDSGQVRDREAICMLDTQYTDGKSTLTMKKSSFLTQCLPQYQNNIIFSNRNKDTIKKQLS